MISQILTRRSSEASEKMLNERNKRELKMLKLAVRERPLRRLKGRTPLIWTMPMISMARTSSDTPRYSMTSLRTVGLIGQSKEALSRFRVWILVALQRVVARARDSQHVEIALLSCR